MLRPIKRKGVSPVRPLKLSKQIVKENPNVNELLMQEVRSGTYTSYGVIHGQGPHEWYTLAEMDYVTLKSILLFKSVGHKFVQM